MESGLLVGFLLPGDSILFTAGLLAAEPASSLSLPVLAGGSFACAAAGNGVGYWTGHRFGRPWLLHRAGRAARHVERAEQFYLHYGWLAVVVARFVPWARTFVPVAAGVARMDRRRYFFFSTLGAVIWAGGVTLLGYFLGSIPFVRDHVSTIFAIVEVVLVAVVVLSVAPILIETVRRRRRGGAATPVTTPDR